MDGAIEPGFGKVQGSSRKGSCTSLRQAAISFMLVVSSRLGNLNSNGARRPCLPKPEAVNFGRPPDMARVFNRVSRRWFSYKMRETVVCTASGS
jgi:hypothetical protein